VVRKHCAVFRVDASTSIGTGHVMRCLTLADRLRNRMDVIHFLSREHEGNLVDLIDGRGFPVTRLPTTRTADAATAHSSWLGASLQDDSAQCLAAIDRLGARPSLLVVDHYALDKRWERALRPAVERILAIDDLADRPHECDVLLDQNLHESPESCYSGLVDSSTRVFVGPRYALLRPEFDAVTPRVRDSGVNAILAFFGGDGESDEIMKLLDALRALDHEAPRVTVVTGHGNPNTSKVRHAARELRNIRIVETTSRMADLMVEADLGVGTCGGAAWERCAVGLPTLAVITAENQREDARLLHERGAVRNLGEASDMTAGRWADAILTIKHDPEALKRMSLAAADVLQGRAGAMQELEAALVV
jgi:UDP-2,4-diacetamido-2,4,6-trideoxy-beta-L-altropyranose hydrolase